MQRDRSEAAVEAAEHQGQAPGRQVVGPSGRPAELLLLQRQIGNQGVVQLLRASQGDGEASKVVIQRATAGGGRPVDAATRVGVEQHFGQDLSGVRVHTGPDADASAAVLGASAYTVGDDIVLGRGGAPSRATLHHELTHVVQQRQGPVAGTHIGGGVAVSDPTDRFEREAAHVASDLSGGGHHDLGGAERAPASGSSGPGSVQRMIAVQRYAGVGGPAWLRKTLDRLASSKADTGYGKNVADLATADADKMAYDILKTKYDLDLATWKTAHKTWKKTKIGTEPVRPTKPKYKPKVTADTPMGMWAPTHSAGSLDMLKAGGKHDYSDVDKQDNYATAKSSMGAKASAGARRQGAQAQAMANAAAGMELSADAHGKVGDDEGFHAEGGAHIKTNLSAEAGAKAGGGLLKNDRGIPTDVYAELEAHASTGASLSGGADGAVGFKSLSAGAGVEGAVSVGTEVHGSGNASIGARGANLGGAIGASVGGDLDGEVKTEFKLKDVAAEAKLGVKGWAGAKAETHGVFQAGRSGVKIGGGATAAAGATANGMGEISTKLYDRKVLGLKGGVGVHAGYIYSGGGWFELKGGYIRVNAGLAASVLAPAGGSVNVEPYADLKPIATAVLRNLYGAQWRWQSHKNKAGVDGVISNPTTALKDFGQDLQRYSDLKFRYLQTKTAYNYVKVEKIQQLVNLHFPYYRIRKLMATTKPAEVDVIDKGITEALRAVLKANPGTERVSPKVEYAKIEMILDLYDTGGMTDADDPAFNTAVDGGGAVASTQTMTTGG